MICLWIVEDMKDVSDSCSFLESRWASNDVLETALSLLESMNIGLDLLESEWTLIDVSEVVIYN